MTPDKKSLNIDNCAKCGACVPACPLYRHTGRESLAARGKLHLLQKIDSRQGSRNYASLLSQCLLCGACSSQCPRGLDTPSIISRARQELPAAMKKQAGAEDLLHAGMKNNLLAALLGISLRSLDRTLLHLLPANSGLRLKLSLPSSPTAFSPLKKRRRGEQRKTPLAEEENGEVVSLFNGCYARYLQPRISSAAEHILGTPLRLEILSPDDQVCCGLSFLGAGKYSDAISLARNNIIAFETTTGPIITPCASCYSHLRSYPSLFSEELDWQKRAESFAARLVEFSSFLVDHGLQQFLAKKKLSARLYYHDSCHLRFHQKITQPPRLLLNSIQLLKIVEPDDEYQCCGAGGLFQFHHAELAAGLRRSLIDSISSIGVDKVLTTCSGCLLHLHQGFFQLQKPTDVQHLAVYLADLLSGPNEPTDKNH